MGFLQRGQGLLERLPALCGSLAFLVLVGGGCAPKTANLEPAPAVQVSSQPDACPPVAAQEILPAPPAHRESDFALVFDEEGTLLDGMLSLETDSEESEETSEDSSHDMETVESVPSITDIVLAQYEDWRGVRYRPGGSDYRGVDCSGLVQAIFRDAFEVDLPRVSSDQAKLGESVPRGDIRPGDLLYFVDRGRKHVGVAVDDSKFLHASRRKGVTLSKFDGYWSKRLIRVRRIIDEKELEVPVRKGG